MVLAIVLLAGGFAARSHRRHGALQAQLVRDDASKLLRGLRKRIGLASAQHQRVSTTEELPDEEEGGGAKRADLKAVWLARLQAALPTACAEWLRVFIAMQTTNAVASAADGIGSEIQFASATDADDYEEGGSTGGHGSNDGDASRAEKPSSPEPLPGRGYEWEGEKLSWEVGSGLPPERLANDMADVTTGEEC